ncbi:MAG: beta-N-acetylhexosaminidase [Desulfomonilaceae bacterium]
MNEQDVGNLFMIGFEGPRFTSAVRDFIDELNPCGVVLFARNIQDPEQLAGLNHDLQAHATDRNPEGIFIGVDQEGGRVRRLRKPFAEFGSAFQLASSHDPKEAVRQFARVTADQLRLVGFNLDFAPVLDVLGTNINPDNSVIGDRSYGSDPEIVGELGAIVIQTMRSAGVIPCCKHFPGHGGTSVDSHTDLPEDVRSWELIEKNDLIPFSRAVDANVEMIMTAHVLYRDLDAYYPATLSKSVIHELLRKRMNYQGAVITDDLDMAAVARGHSPEECAFMAFKAGADILLFCNHPEKALAARSRILDAVKHGDLHEERVRESLARIKNLKSKYKDSMIPCDIMRVRDFLGITI